MRLHTDRLAVRVAGSVAGIAFLGVGAYALFGADASVPEIAKNRAAWFGVTALVGGVWAITVSWLDGDPTGVWCASPRGRR